MNMIRTERTYATAANAEKALAKTLEKAGTDLEHVRWMVAVAPDGRFAPVLIGMEYIPFAHAGVTVLGGW